MIVVALRQTMKAYRTKHGKKYTYASLAKASRILARMAARVPDFDKRFATVSTHTLEALARNGLYNTSLKPLNTLCYLLDATTDEILEHTPERLVARAPDAESRRPRRSHADAQQEPEREPHGDLTMPTPLDPVSKAVVEVIEMNEYVVDITRVGETHRATAKRPDGHTYTAEGMDVFRTVCELAEKVGIDLEDG